MFDKKSIIDEFLNGDSREVLYTVGKYSVYAPNKDTSKLIVEMLTYNEDFEKGVIENIDFMRRLFANLTDVPDEILEVDTFSKVFKNPKRIFQKIMAKIQIILSEESVNISQGVNNISQLPHKQQDIMWKKINEANEQINNFK